MRLRLTLVFVFLILGAVCISKDDSTAMNLTAIETYITEPTFVEHISIWVPAARSGPFINRSCRIQENVAFSMAVPASVKHQKTMLCPVQIARILAELTSFYHSQSLPLAIFNGWQWEYTYNICQYNSGSYNLAQRGGCWENSWEVILNISSGVIQLKQFHIDSTEKCSVKKSKPAESTIEVKTFSSMRTRDGYPKERQL
jgi:hypothetical protein